jgi:hypothetical protein
MQFKFPGRSKSGILIFRESEAIQPLKGFTSDLIRLSDSRLEIHHLGDDSLESQSLRLSVIYGKRQRID